MQPGIMLASCCLCDGLKCLILMMVEGSMILLSVILMIATRRLVLGRWWGKA
jgi:hypothetical protein